MYRYKNPPLLEVSCEIIFSDYSGYTPENIQEFSKLISSIFPIQRINNQAGVIFDSATKSFTPAHEEYLEFFSSDEKDLIRLEKTKLSFHQLRPYKKWEHFSSLISSSIPNYTKIFGQSDVARIGLRYVNDIQLEDADFQPSQYFNGMPDFREGFWGETYNGFQCISQKIYHQPVETQMRVSITEGPKDGIDNLKHRVVLDLDIFSLHHKSSDIGALLGWLDTSRKRCNDVFENLLSSKAKAIFNG